MGAFEHQIEELVAFARDRDDNDRSVLFCELTELFTSGRAPQAIEDREHLLDVIEALVPHVAPNTRAGVAGELADMHHPPMDLVMRLIYDDADLVSNLITNAPMDEDSLIEFIAKTGRAHHQELATRTDLSANIWIALARAAPTMPMNRLHNEKALWEDDLGKHHKVQNPMAPKNAEELGINLFMTRPAPEEKIRSRSQSQPPKAIKKSAVKNQKSDNEEDIFLSTNRAANDLSKASLTRKEKRSLDQYVEHKLPKATVELDDFNWQQHVTCDLGWAVLTGRDGNISDLSHSAITFMGLAAERLIGMHLVHLIGLTDRPEHPVVRAISRHGAIHDAPVVLFVGPVGRASWTLTAIPKFEPASGVFEGFNCHFSPVPVQDEDIPVFLDEIEADEGVGKRPIKHYNAENITSITGEVPIISESPLFIEEEDMSEVRPPLKTDPELEEAHTKAVAKDMNVSIDNIREQARKMAEERMAEIQDRLERNEIKEWPTIITEATLPSPELDEEKPVVTDMLKDIFEPSVPTVKEQKKPKAMSPKPVQKVAPKQEPLAPHITEQDMLEDLIETTKAAKAAIKAEEHIQAQHLQRAATIKHMLSMMEEAGERLKNNPDDADPISIQLDTDIAKTCAKALKDLLEN